MHDTIAKLISHNQNEVPVRVPSAVRLISTVQHPTSREETEELNNLIDIDATRVADDTRRKEEAAYETAKAEQKLARAAADENKPRLSAAEAAYEKRKTDRGSFILLLGCLVCFIAAVTAEVDVTWNVLPYVLDVPQYSFAGVMLGIAPSTALVALKIAFGILLWQPWEAVRSDPAKKGTVRWTLVTLFLVFIVLMTSFTAIKMNFARIEASKAKANDARPVGEAIVVVDQEKIDQGVNAVTLCLAINGALFALVAFSEVNRLSAYWRSFFAQRRLRRRQKRFDEKATEAGKRLALAEKGQGQLESRVQQAAEQQRAGLKILLKRADKRRPLREVVDHVLAANIGVRVRADQ